jgi:hypothetical protein
MVNITKKSKIQVALFVSICLIKFFLLVAKITLQKRVVVHMNLKREYVCLDQQVHRRGIDKHLRETRYGDEC